MPSRKTLLRILTAAVIVAMMAGMVVLAATAGTDDDPLVTRSYLDGPYKKTLLSEAERTGSDTIRMTHEQIAQHISSAREAVARMLKQFSEEGLVELKRGAITLRDFDSLKQLT